ncbi:PAS domain-containing protein [Paracoccus ravus]|uniref:PAS domain-containing protein n=1 Tax=Paracoccus ravus TaxID=2447760 RepID=UPI00143183E2|nr:PAS domain-containing protein [Paracoccus ravus]
MARLVEQHDWSATALGRRAGWSAVLSATVQMVLDHGFPSLLLWGRDLVQIYNDGFRDLMGERHPDGLGKQTHDCWPERKSANQQIYDRVWKGESLTFEDQKLPVTRHAGTEEGWFTLTYGPIREAGRVVGILVTACDTSRAHHAARARDDAAKRVSESEARFRSFVNSGADIVYRMNADWTQMRQIDGRRAFSDTAGQNRNWRDEYLLPEDRAQMQQAIGRAMRTQQPFDAEHRMRRADGSVRWVHSRAVPVLGPDGAILEWLGTASDITESRLIEEGLRASRENEAFLQSLSDRLHAAETPEAMIAEASRMLGEKLGATWARFAEIDEEAGLAHFRPGWGGVRGPTHPAILRLSEFGGPLLAELRTGRTVRFDDIGEPPRGRSDLLALAAPGMRSGLCVPLFQDGGLVAILNVHHAAAHVWQPGEESLAETAAERLWSALGRARAEAARRKSEARYREFFNSIDEGFCIVELLFDPAGEPADFRFVESNMAFARQTGLEDATGTRLSALAPEHAEYWRQIRARIARTGRTARFEQQAVALGRWFDVYAFPSGDPREHRLCILVNDITRRKLHEELLWERESWLAAQKEAFRTAMNGAAPEESLGKLTRFVSEQKGWGCRGAFHIADPEHAEFRHVIGNSPGPDLPRQAGPRGAARDEIGAEFVTEPATSGPAHRRGWFFPVETAAGKSVGSFALCFDEPHRMQARERQLASAIAQAGSIIISHYQEASERGRVEERLRQFGEASQDVIWIRDAERLQWQYLTPAFETIYGLTREEALQGNNYRSWLDLILPEDRPRAEQMIARVRRGDHVTFEYRVRRPADGTIRWLRSTDFPITDGSGRITMIGGIGHDLTESHEMEKRLTTLLEGIPQLVWRAVGQGRWTWSSPQWAVYTGLSARESAGRGWLQALHPEDREAALQSWDQAGRTGILEFEGRIRHQPSQSYRWFQTRATALRDQGGTIIEWLGTSTDIDDNRMLQDRQRILVAELQHRTRNIMGVVRSLADKTSRASASLADFRAGFHDRLDALARVQSLLSRLDDLDRVTFDELIATELAAMDVSPQTVTLDGPKGIRLRSSTVQTLAMALHELATNAVKYGALGQPRGRLSIVWRFEPAGAEGKPWLHIDWRESGVEMPSMDTLARRSGQGRELIERALPYQLSAKTSYTLGRDGVHCAMSLPVSSTNHPVDIHD